MRLIMLTLACKGLLFNDTCHVRFATLVDKKRAVRDDIKYNMNQLENFQARYRSNTWMGRTRTDGPNEFEPLKFDCIHQVTIEIRFRKSLAQERFKSNLEFRNQIIVSSIKF